MIETIYHPGMSLHVPDDLEAQVADTMWAIDLDIAHTPVIPFTLGTPPPLIGSSGVLRPVHVELTEHGGILIYDRTNPAESAVACARDDLLAHRARYINYRNWLARKLALRELPYNARVAAVSWYFDGMEPGPGLARMMRWQ